MSKLYDLRRDPHQVRNVAADPAYSFVRAQLEKRLLAELQRTGDPRMMDDGRLVETPPMAGPPEDLERTGGRTPAELRGEQ